MKRFWRNFKDGFYKSFGIFAGLLVLSALTVAVAQTFTTFSSGDLISATTINENFQVAAPSGAVMAFHLSACPSGWVAADGTGGTPDLRGQFIRGLNDFGSAAGARADGDQDPGGGGRALGDYQADAFQGHRHGYSPASGVVPVGGKSTGSTVGSGSGSVDLLLGLTDNIQADSLGNGTPRTTSETRVKNVGLIYCIRS